MSIAAIILAAGLSTRMDGHPKGLVTLGGQTLLDRCASAISRNGVSDIRVVTGHRAAEIPSAHEYSTIYNPDYHQGMFSSVQAGLRSFAENGPMPDAAFILPVDAALVKPRTVMDILEHWAGELTRKPTERRILVPGMLGRTGHPILVPARFFATILEWSGDYGLRGCLASLLPRGKAADFLNGRLDAGLDVGRNGPVLVHSVADQGVLSDLDSPQDIAEAEAFLEETENRSMPSPEEAWQMLSASSLTPAKIRHSVLVGLGSFRLALALNHRGFPAHPELCLNAGLLHDLFRSEREHAMRVFEALSLLGWPKTAFVAGCHTILPPSYRKRMGIDIYDSGFMHPPVPDAGQKLADELFYSAITVYLTDKYVRNDEVVTVPERFGSIRDWFAKDQERVNAINRREQIVTLAEEWFRERLWAPPAEVAFKSAAHPLEERLESVFTQSAVGLESKGFNPWGGPPKPAPGQKLKSAPKTATGKGAS